MINVIIRPGESDLGQTVGCPGKIITFILFFIIMHMYAIVCLYINTFKTQVPVLFLSSHSPVGRGKVLGGQSSEAGLALTFFKRDLPPRYWYYDIIWTCENNKFE